MGTSVAGDMDVEFRKHSGKPSEFFKLLPLSWSKGLLEVWQDYRVKSEIFVLVNDGKIVAGGIVVKGVPEDMQHFLKEAMFYASQGYLYIGYLWVVESHRNQNLGSRWLWELKKLYPQKTFWLSIEEEKLKDFYLRNDFTLEQELKKDGNREWIMVFDRSKI